jgi:hypothetical protein
VIVVSITPSGSMKNLSVVSSASTDASDLKKPDASGFEKRDGLMN